MSKKTYQVQNVQTRKLYTVEDSGIGEYVKISWPDYGTGPGGRDYERATVEEFLSNGTWVVFGVENKEQWSTSVSNQGPAALGIYRPNLETRKIGKVRVELLDDGFPLALREIAKVMTWAQDAKGYKDHDWQNLPNAEVALAAAASRHRTDHIKQRVVEGLPIKQCVDSESNLLHKAHEAFGVLAQLELMLRQEYRLTQGSI